MTRKLKPATPRQRQRLKEALLFLVEARKCVVDADCPATLRKVRSALKSAEGAARHMDRRVAARKTARVCLASEIPGAWAGDWLSLHADGSITAHRTRDLAYRFLKR